MLSGVLVINHNPKMTNSSEWKGRHRHGVPYPELGVEFKIVDLTPKIS